MEAMMKSLIMIYDFWHNIYAPLADLRSQNQVITSLRIATRDGNI